MCVSTATESCNVYIVNLQGLIWKNPFVSQEVSRDKNKRRSVKWWGVCPRQKVCSDREQQIMSLVVSSSLMEWTLMYPFFRRVGFAYCNSIGVAT
jgi:hypothetical protein